MTWTILGLLAFAALSLCIFAFWLRHRTRPGAVFALLMGVALAVLTGTYLYPALTDDSASIASRDLRRQLAEAQSTNAALAAERNRLADDKQSLTAGLAAATERVRDAERTSVRRVERIEASVVDLYARYDRPESPLAFDHARRPAPRTAAGLDDRTDAVIVDLDGLLGLRPKPTTASIDRPAATKTLMRLKDSMATNLKTDNYDVEAYPSRDLVAGRNGRYYVVDLKNASTGIRYFFEGGKYTLRTSNSEFRTSLNAFITDVLSKMDGNVTYELFVRGSADQKPWSGRMDPAAPIQKITVMKQAGRDRYSSDVADVRFDTAIQNTDLPNLRAAFLRNLVAEIYPVKAPHILEGVVSSKVDDRDRNAELILFVDW